VDLYRDAREFPSTLIGARTPARCEAVRASGITKDALSWRARHGRLDRPHQGAYLLGRSKPDLLDDIRAALLVSPPNSVIGYHTAAQLMGFGIIRSSTVHIVVPAGGRFPQRRGITVHQSVVPIEEPETVLGVSCTSATRCALDLARGLRRLDALPVLDAAVATGRCDLEGLLAELKRHDGLRGVYQARSLVPLADPRPQCRQESQLRLILYDGGLRCFVPQLPVLDEDGFVRYYLDLADEATLVAAEFDGASHLDRTRLRADRDRHNWLEGRGWRMRYFTDRDIYYRPDGIVDTLGRARSSSRSRPSSRDW
jgi:very-short-patch-repair endonuclease